MKASKLILSGIAVAAALTVAGHIRAEETGEHDEASEQHLKLADLPPAARKAIKDKAGDGKVTEIEKHDRDAGEGGPYYEAEVDKRGTKTEIDVAPDGKLLKSGAADEDDEGDEKKPDKD